jgi:hypothetical protein
MSKPIGDSTTYATTFSDLTGSVPPASLPVFVGDSGSGGVAGAVPAPGAGDAAAGKFLKANGSWVVPSGGGSSGNFLQVTVDFGFSSGNEGDIARVTVTGQSWVTSGSVILANVFAGTTSDHSPDDAIAEGLVAFIENIVAGVGFDVVVYAPQNSWGRYLVNITGV